MFLCSNILQFCDTALLNLKYIEIDNRIMALQQLYFLDLWRLTKTEYLTMNPSIISKCQIQNFKEPFWHFEMTLLKANNS